MNDRKSKTFFSNLKETVGFINKAVSDVTTAASDIPSECNLSQVYRDFKERIDDVKQMRKDAVSIKNELENKRAYFGNYFHDVQDLVLEIEESVDKHEKHLQKYGFEPLKVDPVVEPLPSPEAPPSEKKAQKGNKTPSIYDFIGAGPIDQRKRSASSAEKKETEDLKLSDGTPTLILDQSLRKYNRLTQQSPADETKNTEDIVLEGNILQPPPVSLNLENSVVDGPSMSEISYDYQKIARRLDFFI